MRIPIDRDSAIPLYTQIQQFLRQQIESRTLARETRLPATRELAHYLGVSRMTVINAYAELEAEGFVYSLHGSGTFVASPPKTVVKGGGVSDTAVSTWPLWQQEVVDQADIPLQKPHQRLIAAANQDNIIQFTSGIGAMALFDVDEFRKTLQAVLRRDGTEALGYGEAPHGGYAPLRSTIAQILSHGGVPAHPENVLITSGSQQALAVVARLLLHPGDNVLVENPTYEAGLDLFRSLGVQPMGIPIDSEGMQIDKLEEALRTAHPRLIYTIPTFHNPTGISMSTRRRQRLVAMARHYNVPILEDDFAGDLRYEGYAQPALKALDPEGTVIYVNTFSKSLIPGLRIGYLVATGPVYERLLVHKRAGDRSSSNFMQRALEAYITVGRYQSHLRKVCRVCRQRLNAMHKALQHNMPPDVHWQKPQGGLFLWLELPVSTDDLLPVALQEGVAFAPGSLFYTDGQSRFSLRLNFTAHEPPTIAEGMRRLARAIKKAR